MNKTKNFLHPIFIHYITTSLHYSFLTAVLCAGFFAALFHNNPVDFSALEQYETGRPSILLDDTGKEWARFALDKREPVNIQKVPKHLIQAFVAAEDWHFFSHSGISFKGIVRSTLVNLYHGRIVQGASTITQQLVKLLFFDSQRTFKRKIQEQLYALLVEQQFTKEQILQTYLNHVYFGAGIYGVEAAAQRFWGISAQKLSVAHSALLAAIVRSPGHYCPLWFPLSAIQRRNVILHQMKRRNFLTESEYETAIKEQLNLVEQKENNLALHAKETLRTQLEQLFSKEQLYTGGLIVQTTLNQEQQKIAEQAFTKQMQKLQQSLGPEIEGGFLSIDVKTGAIKALVGGVSFAQSQFNRALQAQRQQGSAFKPLLYSAALLEGFSYLDIAIDEPLTVQQGNQIWEPKNHTLEYEGPMTLARALSYSNNIISAKIILAIGPQKVIDLAKKCRIKGPLYPYPSLSLGCVDSTVSEVAGMFNIFANNGIYVEPHLITWVKDRWGKKIYRTQIDTQQVLPPEVAQKTAQVLSFGTDRRKRKAKEWVDSDAINKTGTTNDSRTCWFAGSTPELTTVIYVGFDDNRSMGKNIYPVYTAFPIWLNYHKKIPTKTKTFYHSPTLHKVPFNIKTGKQTSYRNHDDIFYLLV